MRAAYLLRYHKTRQLWRRLAKILRQKTGGGIVRDGGTEVTMAIRPLPAACHDLLEFRRQQFHGDPDNILGGKLSFLGETKDLGWPYAWNATSHLDALWQFHLHYHEFLYALTTNDFGSQQAWQIVLDWIDNYPANEGRQASIGWHPFCISRRIPVWVLLLDRYPPKTGEDRILNSLLRQARHLRQNLELDLEGNHLLENLRALVFASAVLPVVERDEWMQTVAKILRWQATEQILPHGEHFERSTMYHAVVFELMLDIADLTTESGGEVAEICEATIPAMANFTNAIRCPDGSLPQFADAEQVPPHVVDSLLVRGKKLAGEAFGVEPTKSLGGYWIHRQSENLLIFDAAHAGPDHLPGHAHADLLNIELWLDGAPVIVDSGVYDYAATPWREYCRSSAAHSVLMIDGQSQFDQWSRFRMGYRGHPWPLLTGNNENTRWAECAHNAYRRYGFPSVGRRVGTVGNDHWLCVDWVPAGPRAQLTSLIQLHPDVSCDVTQCTATLTVGDRQYHLQILGDTRIVLGEGWLCPKFGHRIARPIIRVESVAKVGVPAAIGWTISRKEAQSDFWLDANDQGWLLRDAESTIWQGKYDSRPDMA